MPLAPRPLRRRIVLSCAHADGESGVRSSDGRLEEHAYSQLVVCAAATQLIEEGHDVRLVEELLVDKVLQINAWDPACVVEPHINRNPSAPLARGYYPIHHRDSPRGRALAVELERALFGRFGSRWPCVDARGRAVNGGWGPKEFPSAWVARDRLPLLEETRAPAVIVELGFASSEADVGFLLQPDTAEQIGHALADGICRWLATDGGGT